MQNTQVAQYQQQENNSWKNWFPKRGEIYLVDLGQENNLDSEQRGLRPFAITSNNIGNMAGTILVGCSITTKNKALRNIHVPVGKEEGLKFDNYILTEHIRSVSKRRFFINGVATNKLKELEKAIMFELGFNTM